LRRTVFNRDALTVVEFFKFTWRGKRLK